MNDKVVKQKRVQYDIHTLKMVIREVRRIRPLHDVEERYAIPKSTLNKYKNSNLESLSVGAGRKTALTTVDEQSLFKYLYEMGKYGCGLTKDEVLFIQEFD